MNSYQQLSQKNDTALVSLEKPQSDAEVCSVSQSLPKHLFAERWRVTDKSGRQVIGRAPLTTFPTATSASRRGFRLDAEQWQSLLL